MSNPKKKYSSYAEFEKEEYLRVKSFYENLEELMDDELYAHCADPFDTKYDKDGAPEELKF